MGNIKWLRIAIAGVGVHILNLLLFAGFVTASSMFWYVVQPTDAGFNQAVSIILGPVLAIGMLLFTVGVSWVVARGAVEAKALNGLLVGIVVLIISLWFYDFEISLLEILFYIGMPLAGWLGGRLSKTPAPGPGSPAA